MRDLSSRRETKAFPTTWQFFCRRANSSQLLLEESCAQRSDRDDDPRPLALANGTLRANSQPPQNQYMEYKSHHSKKAKFIKETRPPFHFEPDGNVGIESRRPSRQEVPSHEFLLEREDKNCPLDGDGGARWKGWCGASYPMREWYVGTSLMRPRIQQSARPNYPPRTPFHPIVRLSSSSVPLIHFYEQARHDFSTFNGE